jgi:phage tail-like protein
MGFMRISGLQADVGIYEWQEVSDPLTKHKFPDRINFSDVTFERGVTSNRYALWEWYTSVTNSLYSGVPGDFRRTVTIYSFFKGVPRSSLKGLRVWEIYSAFPKVLKFGEFNATDSSVVIESLTLANEGYKVVRY